MSESPKPWPLNGAELKLEDTFTILEKDPKRYGVSYEEFVATHPDHYEDPVESESTPVTYQFGPGLGKQIGGTHYQEMTIQPMEYSYANKLNPIAHSIIKYATRAGKKDSEDIRKEIQKIKHCADIWLDLLDKHGEK